jgi:hypothetical protein
MPLPDGVTHADIDRYWGDDPSEDATHLAGTIDALQDCRNALADRHACIADPEARRIVGRYVMLLEDILHDARSDVKGGLFDLGIVE